MLCYTPRAIAIAKARAQRDATERSEFKKHFSIKFILIGLYSIFINLFFVLALGKGELNGKFQKPKTPY